MIGAGALLAGAVLALWYGAVLTHTPVSLLRSAVKTAATLALVWIAVRLDAALLITLGLMCGALGDYFLSRPRARGFLPGLIAFLAGHMCYLIWAVTLLIDRGPLAPTGAQIGLIVGLLAIGGLLLRQLWPVLAGLKAPVALYIAVSLGLGACAILLPLGGFTLGVLAFIGSDIILAVQLFLMRADARYYRLASSVLWALYWGGQAAIVYGSGTLV